MYPSTYDCGNIDGHKFEAQQLATMKKSCQQHCFSTLNHNLAYCYNDARVIKFVWTQLVKNRMKGGAMVAGAAPDHPNRPSTEGVITRPAPCFLCMTFVPLARLCRPAHGRAQDIIPD